MKIIFSLFFACCLALVCHSQTNSETFGFTNETGKWITARVVKVEPGRIIYQTEDFGLSAIQFTNLPPEIQKRFHYNPEVEKTELKIKAERQAREKAIAHQRAAEAWAAAHPPEMPPLETVDVLDGSVKVVGEARQLVEMVL